MSLLDSDDESLDISIQFFGLEWKLVLKRWERVGKNVQIMFNTWIQQNKKVKVDMLLFGDIIKSINQTSAEIESHRAAITCGQLTEDQKQCQLKIRNLSIHKSQEIVSTNLEAADNNGRGICFSERLRRKSVKLNESIGKHLKCSLRRRNSQIIRNKVNFTKRSLFWINICSFCRVPLSIRNGEKVRCKRRRLVITFIF